MPTRSQTYENGIADPEGDSDGNFHLMAQEAPTLAKPLGESAFAMLKQKQGKMQAKFLSDAHRLEYQREESALTKLHALQSLDLNFRQNQERTGMSIINTSSIEGKGIHAKVVAQNQVLLQRCREQHAKLKLLQLKDRELTLIRNIIECKRAAFSKRMQIHEEYLEKKSNILEETQARVALNTANMKAISFQYLPESSSFLHSQEEHLFKQHLKEQQRQEAEQGREMQNLKKQFMIDLFEIRLKAEEERLTLDVSHNTELAELKASHAKDYAEKKAKKYLQELSRKQWASEQTMKLHSLKLETRQRKQTKTLHDEQKRAMRALQSAFNVTDDISGGRSHSDSSWNLSFEQGLFDPMNDVQYGGPNIHTSDREKETEQRKPEVDSTLTDVIKFQKKELANLIESQGQEKKRVTEAACDLINQTQSDMKKSLSQMKQQHALERDFLQVTQQRELKAFTGLKVKEQALSNAAQELLAVSAAMRDALIVIDSQGIMESFNEAACHIFQYDEDEVIGKNVKILMPDRYANAHDGYIRDFLRTGEAHIIGIGRALTARTSDGNLVSIFLSVSQSVVRGRLIFIGNIHPLQAMSNDLIAIGSPLELELRRLLEVWSTYEFGPNYAEDLALTRSESKEDERLSDEGKRERDAAEVSQTEAKVSTEPNFYKMLSNHIPLDWTFLQTLNVPTGIFTPEMWYYVPPAQSKSVSPVHEGKGEYQTIWYMHTNASSSATNSLSYGDRPFDDMLTDSITVNTSLTPLSELNTVNTEPDQPSDSQRQESIENGDGESVTENSKRLVTAESNQDNLELYPQGCPSGVAGLRLFIRHLIISTTANHRPPPTKITDRLYLGSICSGLNRNWLKHEQITHIVSVGDSKRGLVYPFFPDLFTYALFDLADLNDRDFAESVTQTILFLDSALQQNGTKVLVHGETGVHRAPTILVAYLITQHGMPLNECIDLLRDRNPHISLGESHRDWPLVKDLSFSKDR